MVDLRFMRLGAKTAVSAPTSGYAVIQELLVL